MFILLHISLNSNPFPFSLPFTFLSFTPFLTLSIARSSPSILPVHFFILLIQCYLILVGSESPCHHDPFHNILCQVYGTKHVLLFSPEQHVRTCAQLLVAPSSLHTYIHTDYLFLITNALTPVCTNIHTHINSHKSKLYFLKYLPIDKLFSYSSLLFSL